MVVFADLVPHTPGRDRRIANQIRCRPTEGHSDALGWKEPRGEADATDKSQHQLRVKGVDKRRERGSAGEPLRSSRTAVPGTARRCRASARMRRRRTGAAAGGRGKEKCRGCSGPAACRWAPRVERTPHPRQSPWACARAPHRAVRGRKGPSTSLLDQLWTVFTQQNALRRRVRTALCAEGWPSAADALSAAAPRVACVASDHRFPAGAEFRVSRYLPRRSPRAHQRF